MGVHNLLARCFVIVAGLLATHLRHERHQALVLLDILMLRCALSAES